ncbi:lytic transglycosylase domain-containing protein [Shewanella sp. GXUN23E]|uniref:lytic transglycosylase domain-containing protein n=1 Tax=Shewanella sp. GXUN23E TaxID=3422498 RepID=UPI003D7E5635
MLLILLPWSPLLADDGGNKPRIVARYSEQGISKEQDKVRVYRHLKADGRVVFSDKPPIEGEFDILLYDCFACQPESKLDWHRMALETHRYARAIDKAAKAHQLDSALIRAVIHAESNFNPHALSRRGAMGLMQLMPPTAKELGISNAFEADANIFGGSAYLSKMLARFNGDLDFALAAYNAGPTSVDEYQGVPPFAETRAYVERVKILLKRYRDEI